MIKINPTIEKQHNGLFLCDIVEGTYFRKLYQGFSKREAVKLFRAFVKQELGRV
jgi:hypothetical protein